jgi:phosphoribosylglycinamide formyltransferase-1
MRIGVLVSGSGTNLQAILDACATGELPAEVVCVISDREDAYALVRAGCAGLPAMFLDPKAYHDAAAFNHAILDVLNGCSVDYVVMAGYMRLLGKEVLDAFPMRVVNIHPALLPAFPGPHGIRDAFNYGVKVTGVTVHFANGSSMKARSSRRRSCTWRRTTPPRRSRRRSTGPSTGSTRPR